MEILIKALQFILSLSFLIVLHEMGHFIPAKLFKTRVEKFYLFFDYKFSLFKKKIKDTEYGIGWIPLGGYVKIAGMIDESMDTEQLKKEPQPWEFRSKPAWQRLIIMLGGVIVNFILGWLIYVGVTFYWGDNYIKAEDVTNGFSVSKTFENYGFQVGDKILKVNNKIPDNVLTINRDLLLREVSSIEVQHPNGTTETIKLPSNIGDIVWKSGNNEPFRPRSLKTIIGAFSNTLADKAGIKRNDKIISINGKRTEFFSDVVKEIKEGGDILNIVVDRNGEQKQFEISFIGTKERKLGIYPEHFVTDIERHHKDYSLSEAIIVGSSKAYWTLQDYITQFKFVFTKKGATQIGGFISIGKIFPSYWNWQSFWNITAFLSIMLGFMNLLPIPALDGGHVLFTLWEIVTGRKPSDKFLEYAQIFGFVLLMSLLIYANGNDILKLFN